MFTKKILQATKNAYDKDTDGIGFGAVAGILACIPIVPAAILGVAAVADAALLTGKVLSAIGTSPPSPEQRRAQAIQQVRNEYARDIAIANTHQDPDERESYAAGALARARSKLAQIAQW